MKTAAVIAEFNPFHNGHQYLLDTLKKEYGIDCCVAIMSGDYVQRGDVAIVNKHKRAEIAARAGFSAVFELPLIYAVSAADDFAYGGAAIADSLGVDYLVFGSESGDITSLSRIAHALLSPSEDLDRVIRAGVKSGVSYAKAVSSALKECHIIEDDFFSPNDILGVEYIKALKKLNSKVVPIAIKRTGAAHDSSESDGHIASATYLRSEIKEAHDISAFMPVFPELKPLFIDDFYDMLMYRLHFADYIGLINTPGISKDLANKIQKYSWAPDYRSLVDSIKSKNFSESTIRRALIHILLGQQKNDIFYPNGHIACPEAVRLLAARQSDSAVIRYFKDKEGLTIYTRPSDINDKDAPLLKNDLLASDLYNKVYSFKYNAAYISDLQTSPIIIK